jgi:metal-responsive CopG/Arc/MetJ family transcriptional regulator
MNKVRTTVVLPETTAAKLRDRVPPRKRSEFVTEAIESHLMQLAFQTERESSFGTWSDEDYPHLQNQEDVNRHIAALRDDDGWRTLTDSKTR